MQIETIQGQWLTAKYIKDGIWRISDNGQDNMYLVIGSEKALVIDTGFGVENLAEFIKQITPLPVIVAVTHGHLDHALGNDAFDVVYAGKEDKAGFTDASPDEMRSFIQNSKLLTEVKEMPKFNGSGTHAKLQDLVIEEYMEFDLGDRSVIARLTPGHTAGSVCFLDKKAGVLFTGDSFVPSDTWGPVWLHIKDSTALSVFHEKMCSVLAAGGFDYLLSGHGDGGLVPASQLQIFLDGIKDIIDGRICGVLENTFAGNGLRCDWQGSSIIYDPDKIS
jgi:hydroxyacylglutathione hydrolase